MRTDCKVIAKKKRTHCDRELFYRMGPKIRNTDILFERKVLGIRITQIETSDRGLWIHRTILG